MAIGLVTSPVNWVLGTVLPPSWAQNVQDNENGLINGTGPTLKALQIDGTGGNASTQPSGTIALSGTGMGSSLPQPSEDGRNDLRRSSTVRSHCVFAQRHVTAIGYAI
jgi:hypothetical protein